MILSNGDAQPRLIGQFPVSSYLWTAVQHPPRAELVVQAGDVYHGFTSPSFLGCSADKRLRRVYFPNKCAYEMQLTNPPSPPPDPPFTPQPSLHIQYIFSEAGAA